jgi:hypothetical protein
MGDLVERLRDLADDLSRDGDSPGAMTIAQGCRRIAELEDETAQIVAWLRSITVSRECDGSSSLQVAARFLADAIERGDHLPAPPQATDQMEVGGGV